MTNQPIVDETMLFSPRIRYGAHSDKGKREENQDSFFIHENEWVSSFAVADGAGGHQFGKQASQLTIQALKSEFQSNRDDSLEYIKRLVEKKYEQVNGYIFEEAQKRNIMMATTLSLLIFVNQQMLISNVGDTKIYRIRDGEITCLSEVHTFAVQEYERGKITREQLKQHKFKHVLTKAIGGSRQLSPYMSIENAFKNDVYVICTDGLYNYFNEEELLHAFKEVNGADLEQICKQCVQEALNKGSDDNITMIAVQII